MGWTVNWEFSFSFFCLICSLRRSKVARAFWIASSGNAPVGGPGLTCYPYIRCGSTLYRFQSGQRSARRPFFKTGHPKAQGSTRSPLRSKRFMRLGRQKVNATGSPPGNFWADKCLAPNSGCGHGAGDRALRERNLSTAPSVDCGCIRAWPGAGLGRRSLPEGWLRKPWPKAKNSSSPHSDLLVCS